MESGHSKSQRAAGGGHAAAGAGMASDSGFGVCSRGLLRQKKEADHCTELERYLILANFCIAAFKKGRKEL